MAKATLPTNPTAAQVRASLGLPVQRGQLSEAVIAQYNKGKRANKRYTRGQSGTVAAAAKAERAAQRDTLRAQGVAVGTRGPLPKVALSQPKG